MGRGWGDRKKGGCGWERLGGGGKEWEEGVGRGRGVGVGRSGELVGEVDTMHCMWMLATCVLQSTCVHVGYQGTMPI